MGGGNAQKSEIARQRNAAAAAAKAGGKSQMADNAKSMSIKCTICKQAFMCTQGEQDLQTHVTSKHPKSTFEDCFPDMVKYVAVPNQGVVFKGKALALSALGSDAKKGYPKDCGAVEFQTKEEAIAHVIAEVSYINDEEGVEYREE
uniref:Uncharacterized protein n=1 Tax=Hemiselmis andersenii TaxID=464988 RepID=A0A6U4UFZ4_HEMAN|mmetsp:Transcript_36006/g.84272  ORF Transcript_36006/g.84272 Transcript_36006/m.84272 type:complete len:146 (-) Transcript_36006:99-536(-)|eukprot:CAMPEP_0114129896 /NCGR_PEP_ID=MMETSP0043_2-20121206/11719_1 /TAXON_ID=464988 /ORGANISM="Hemiselmis andersenii, Strain CCMP644" /LENGTH=145 /DNA_ID=CAMNT_0001223201 /DNA_START=60 /DNA_END=497 /DNA_ORIENTATION=-